MPALAFVDGHCPGLQQGNLGAHERPSACIKLAAPHVWGHVQLMPLNKPHHWQQPPAPILLSTPVSKSRLQAMVGCWLQ